MAGVATEHAHYKDMAPKWKRARHAVEGQDALRSNALDYIPQLTDQTPESYKSYAFRSVYFNASARTIEGSVGLLFRKPPTKKLPAGLDKYENDIDMAGEPLADFVQKCAHECFSVGRVGILVDHPPKPKDVKVLTQAIAERLGLRPMMTRYHAEDIINWQCQRINNSYKLSKVVLKEEASLAGNSEFEEKTEQRYRVLDLVEANGVMAYRQRVFRINKDTGRDEQIGEDVFPTVAGKMLDEIPFVIMGVRRLGPTVDKPPMMDLIDTNLAHYRVTADYEHGCHFTGLPTPYIAGYQPTDINQKMYIGSSAAWGFTDPQTKVGFLEFTGQGMATLERNLDRKEKHMAQLGARALFDAPAGVEAASTAMIHQNGDNSILATVAQVLTLGFEKALTFFALWASAPGEIKYDINRDFFPMPMTPQMLTALVQSWQAGAFSEQVLFDNLKQGEVIADDTEFEDEQARKSEAPLPRPASANPTTGQPGGGNSNDPGGMA